jgi:tricorn protease
MHQAGLLKKWLAPIALFLVTVAPLQAQLELPKEEPIRIGRYPAASPDGSRFCFTYQGNLWMSPIDGGPATRLTANDSYDSSPRWSPDGKWIAFNSDREGGTQVFLIPAVGGPARQVTFHSAPTLVHDWFPDGKRLVVTSTRETFRQSIYSLDALTGAFKRLVKDENTCAFPSLSPDGQWLAYTRGAIIDTIRKGYKGSANFDVYVAPVDGSSAPKPLTEDDRNDMWPMWGADNRTVYFTSERGGIATIWKQARDNGPATRVVDSPPDAIRYPSLSRNGKTLVFECDNRICTSDASPSAAGSGALRPVSILCRTDERGPRTTRTTFSGSGVTEASVSNDGKQLAFVLRGDVYTVSIAKGGDAKRLTDTPTRDREISWSPDGKSLVFSSNRDGGYRLYTVDVATGATSQLTKGNGSDSEPVFSPDGKWIAFLRGPQTALYVIRPDGSGEQLAAAGPKVWELAWSPDSKWLAFTKEDTIRTDDIWLVKLGEGDEAIKPGTPINVTDHPGYNYDPMWADNGKLLFRSNRYRNRDIETINHSGRFALFSLSLLEEKQNLDDGAETPAPEMKPTTVTVDAREIERRAKQVSAFEEGITAAKVSPDGKTVVFVGRSLGRGDLWQIGVDGSGLQRLTTTGESPGGFQWAADSSRFYYLSGGAVKWMTKGGGGSGTVGFTVRLEVDRLVDYRAAFDEAWQILNDGFYDRNFHGVDWKAMQAKYRPLIDHATTRRDFNYLVTQMFGELNASHTGISSGPPNRGRETGYLGIFPDEEYAGPGVKIADIMPRSPAEREESRLKAGEFILSVDGVDVTAGAELDKALAEKSGRTVTLIVNAQAAKDGARTVKLKPITRARWQELVYERWLDGKRTLAERLSASRVGYLHVADMGDDSRNRFERELFSVGQRTDAMILDCLLKILERNRVYFNFAPRRETPFPQPERAFQKPVILLIDEHSLSDAEVFANGFRQLGLGKIVGQPTMGWIIFTTSRTLVDGSSIRLPHIGCYTLDGRDMENWGVPPDIRVPYSPTDYAAGKDPQLERAVQELLKDPRMKKK